MSCARIIDFDCATRLGDSFVGHKYECIPGPGDPPVEDLVVEFFDRYQGKVDALDYTVANGRVVRTGDVWEMQTRVITGISPGVYTYKVRVTYQGGNKETIIQGTKTFEA